MTDNLNKKLLLGLSAVIILVNMWVLAGVFLNKSEITSKVVLSERELTVPYFYDTENSGLSLRIDYRFLTNDGDGEEFYRWHSPKWLDKEKMQSLGFSEKELSLENTDSLAEKEVFIALELDGAAYQESLNKAKRKYEQTLLGLEQDEIKYAKNHLLQEEKNSSRLFAIDADANLDVLQGRFHQQNNVIITRAVISTTRWQGKSSTGFKVGRIDSLSVSHLYVPYPMNEKVKSLELRDYDDFQPSRFDVAVNIGAHLTPWISDITLTGS